VTEAGGMERSQMMPAPYADQPWMRLGWVIPASLLLWVGLLTVFGLLIARTAAPPPELKPAQVQIIELPPPAGLQGGPASAPASAPPKAKAQPVKVHPHVVRRVIPKPVHHVAKPKVEPEIAPLMNGTAKSTEEEAPPSASAPAGKSAAGVSSGGAAGGTGTSGGSGIGSDSGGARAIFAPKPEIPDDLREQVMSAVAVAHFKVDYDGQVQVTLTTPTDNPRLNEILLDTLTQWRFFPAMKNGVAINSEFDLRIPISVE
jgi:periplasmic protein TonB